MLKVLLPVGVIVLVVISYFGIRSFLNSRNTTSLPKIITKTSTTATNSAITVLPSTIEQRVAELEFSVSDLTGKFKNIPSVALTDISLEARVKTLETSITDLKTRVSVLESSETTTTTSTAKSPIYIPLSWVGSSTSTSWTSITGQEFVINTADYPGFSSMQFEVSMRIFQNGQTFARIEDKDGGTSILSSEVSTTSGSYTWVSSSNFQLPAGSKTYRLQLKSLTGYSADVQNARIKVNF